MRTGTGKPDGSGGRRPGITWSHPLAAGLCLLGLGLAPVQDQGGKGAKVAEVRAALEKYVETERIISQERRDWALGKQVLEDRISLVQRQLEELREKIADADESLGEAGRKRAELEAENGKLEEANEVVSEAVIKLEGRTMELLAKVPDVIQDKVRPVSQRIPEPGAEVELSNGERCSYVIYILNELDKANREVTVTSELRTLDDGRTAEVAVLYAGLGHAWYVTGDGAAGGIGTTSGEGWKWSSAPAAAPAIAQAIAVYNNKAGAAFVPLPIRIR